MDDIIHYQGTIKLSISKRGTIIKTKTLHNKGTVNLFRFLANCLANNFVNTGMPQYIRIFNAGTPGSSVPTIETDIKNILTNNARSNALFMTGSPRAYINDNSNSLLTPYKVSYKYTILDSQIFNKTDLNMFAIYDSVNKGDTTSPSAYFFVTDDEDPTKLGEILTTENQEGDLAIIVEWIMTLSN